MNKEMNIVQTVKFMIAGDVNVDKQTIQNSQKLSEILKNCQKLRESLTKTR